MRQRADRIETDIAPEFEPDFVADPIEHGSLQPRLDEQRGEPFDICAFFSGGFAEWKAVAIDMPDDAGRLDLRRRIDDAPDRALRTQFAPLPSAWIDTLKGRSLALVAVLVEVPVRNPVDRSDNPRVRAQQRLDRFDDAGDRMRLQANDDEILRSQFGGVVGAAGMHDALFITNQQLEAVGTHRGQVSAARDQADIRSRQRQLHAEIAADRAGAVNTDFHAVLHND